MRRDWRRRLMVIRNRVGGVSEYHRGNLESWKVDPRWTLDEARSLSIRVDFIL